MHFAFSHFLETLQEIRSKLVLGVENLRGESSSEMYWILWNLIVINSNHKILAQLQI